MNFLNERLKVLRDRNAISQNALARQIGVTRATVNAWEMGLSDPNAQSLIMLSEHFKVSVDYLLGLEEREIVDISQLNSTEKKMVCDMVNYLIAMKNK